MSETIIERVKKKITQILPIRLNKGAGCTVIDETIKTVDQDRLDRAGATRKYQHRLQTDAGLFEIDDMSYVGKKTRIHMTHIATGQKFTITKQMYDIMFTSAHGS